jgi:hypothetical protein
MKCCQEQWDREIRLPFKYVLEYGYYDGTLSGVTTCIKCGRGYLFNLLTWDKWQDSRIFGFTEINISAEQLAKLLGIEKEMGKHGATVPLGTTSIENLVVLKSTWPTHICTSENSLKTGTWKKAWPMGLIWDWQQWYDK